MKTPFTPLFGKGILCSLIILSSISTFAQSNLEKGWEAFLNNNNIEAKKYFQPSLQNANEKEEALLGMAFSTLYAKDEEETFNYFNDFYKSTKNPAPYVFALWTNPIVKFGGSKKSGKQLDFYNSIIQNPNFDGSLKAAAYGILGSHYTAWKKPEEASQAYKKIGSLEDWQILGEFQNISTSGFDKNYDALNHPLNDITFTDKRGAGVKWFHPPYFRLDKWIDLTNYFEAGNAIVFAQTFIESATAQEIQIRAGVSGSLKVWVNDFLVISESEERNNDLDNYIRKVKLNSGYNRILVQVGESYAGRSNFLIRLTDANGNPISNLKNTATPQKYDKATPYEVEKIPVFAEKYFESLEHEKSIPNQLLLSLCYLRDDKTFEARKVMEGLQAKYPKSTFVKSMFTDLFSKTDNRTGLESAQESIKTNDPESAISLVLNHSFYVSKKDFVKTQEYIDKLEAMYGPDNKTVLSDKISLLATKGEIDKVVVIAEKAYGMYPDYYPFMEIKYLIEKEIKKNNNAAIDILKKYLKTNDSYNASKYLSALYISLGQFNKGIEVLDAEAKADPVSVVVLLDIVRNYFQVQNYEKAKEYENKVIAIAPYNDVYQLDIAKINKSLKKNDEATVAYQKVLELNPNNYDAIRELRELQDKKPLFDYFEKVDVNKILSEAPKQENYPDDNSIILHEEVQTIIYPSGGSEEKHIMIAKVLNTKGIEAWKEYTASASGWQSYIINESEVIKANGQKVPGEVNGQDIVFTNLEIGDAVHVSYTVKNYSQGQLANKFWGTYYFSHYFPYKTTKYSLLVAKNQPFQYTFSQNKIEPVKSVVEDFDLYVFENKNQAAIVREDRMPAIDDVANILHMTTISDWNFVSSWYNDMASAKARPNYEVKEIINTLFKDKKNLSDLAKAKTIYNYITKTINYSSVSFRQSGLVPQEPATVLNTLIGDCKDVSTLFVAMCKEVGLKASLMLVNTRDNGLKSMMLPSIDFNHCMAKLTLDNHDYYLELTSNYLPFATLYNSDLKSLYLDINNQKDKKTLQLMEPKKREANEIIRKVNIKPINTDLLIHEENIKIASMAASVRSVYTDLSEKDRNKKMLDGIKSALPNAELKSLSFKNLENGENRDSLFTSIDYSIKEDIKSIGGIQIITLPWSDKALASDININEDRKFSIDFTNLYNMDGERETIVLEIPEGKNVIENIPSAKLSNAYLDYSLEVKTEKNKITFDRIFKIKGDIIPISDIPAFMEDYKKIVLADSKQLAIK